jgi:hypothetical protein
MCNEEKKATNTRIVTPSCQQLAAEALRLVFLSQLLLVNLNAFGASPDWKNSQIKTDTAAQLLKEFVAQPPESGEILFTISFFPLPAELRTAADNSESNRVEHYYACWRSPDYYILQIADTNCRPVLQATNVLAIGGMQAQKPWYYMLESSVLSISEDKLEDSKNTDVRLMHGFFERRLISALAFGILHASNSLVWKENSFTAKSHEGSAAPISGVLNLGESNQPESIQFRGRKDGMQYGGEVKLTYGRQTRKASLPESYTLEAELGTNRFLFTHTHYHAIAFTNHMSADDFAPKQVIAKLQTPKTSLITSKSALYSITADSRLVPVIDSATDSATANLGSRHTLLFLFIIFTPLFGILLWHARGKVRFDSKQNENDIS